MWSAGAASVGSSSFTGNWATYGGSIRQTAGTLAVSGTTFAGNGYGPGGYQITTGGGAISRDGGSATISGSTISGNWASYGGGFDHTSGTTTLTNVTISGNAAVGGGGFDQGGGSITLVNTTIAGNSASFFAGGIANRLGTLALTNTLLAGNLNPGTKAGFNCYKAVADQQLQHLQRPDLRLRHRSRQRRCPAWPAQNQRRRHGDPYAVARQPRRGRRHRRRLSGDRPARHHAAAGPGLRYRRRRGDRQGPADFGVPAAGRALS